MGREPDATLRGEILALRENVQELQKSLDEVLAFKAKLNKIFN